MPITVQHTLKQLSHRIGSLLISIAMGACTTVPPADNVQASKTVEIEALPASKVQIDKDRPQRSRPPETARRIKPGPIPTRALNVATECSFRDETGYGGKLKLSIDQARVQAFEAAVDIPRRGICRFNLKNFRQTRELPTVELSHLRDPCVVRVWEQGTRVTVAFQQCRSMCSGNAWDHLWPILNDRQDGSCA